MSGALLFKTCFVKTMFNVATTRSNVVGNSSRLVLCLLQIV